MGFPHLHRSVRDGSWIVTGTRLSVQRQQRSWVLRAHDQLSVQWLTRHDLLEAQTPTRRELVRVLGAYIAADPPPADPAPAVLLRRVGPGSHVSTDGRWQLQRTPDGSWDLRLDGTFSATVPTLRTAASTISMLTHVRGRQRLSFSAVPTSGSGRTGDGQAR